MKENPMKEKMIIALAMVLVIGLAWKSSLENTTNIESLAGEELTPVQVENTSMDYYDLDTPETTLLNEAELEFDYSAMNSCTLELFDTDVLNFSEAFGYYRQCLGTDSSFQWQGAVYTTILAEEVIIQVADSVIVDSSGKENDAPETH